MDRVCVAVASGVLHLNNVYLISFAFPSLQAE